MLHFCNTKFFRGLVYLNFAYSLLALPASFILLAPLAGIDGNGFMKLYDVAWHFLFAPVSLSFWALPFLILINLPIKYADANTYLVERYSEERIGQFQRYYSIYFVMLLLVLVIGTGLNAWLQMNKHEL